MPKESSKKKKSKRIRVRIRFGRYFDKDPFAKKRIVRRESHEGDVIEFPANHPAVKQGLESGRFELVED